MREWDAYMVPFSTVPSGNATLISKERRTAQSGDQAPHLQDEGVLPKRMGS